jgi:hypothetical protein
MRNYRERAERAIQEYEAEKKRSADFLARSHARAEKARADYRASVARPKPKVRSKPKTVARSAPPKMMPVKTHAGGGVSATEPPVQQKQLTEANKATLNRLTSNARANKPKFKPIPDTRPYDSIQPLNHKTSENEARKHRIVGGMLSHTPLLYGLIASTSETTAGKNRYDGLVRRQWRGGAATSVGEALTKDALKSIPAGVINGALLGNAYHEYRKVRARQANEH